MTCGPKIVADRLRRGLPENALGRFAVLLGLYGFAVAQPVLAVLGENPYYVSRANLRGAWLVVFTLVVALVPPLVVWIGVSGAGRISRHLGDAVFVCAIGALGAATAMQIAHAHDFTTPVTLGAVAATSAIAVPYLYVRSHRIADWVRYTGVLPLVAALLFLVTSSTGRALLTTPGVAQPAPGSDLAPVVMIMLDELPTRSILDTDDSLDALRFPNLAEFADGATWYRHYTTMAPFTSSAIPSVLSGLVPSTAEPTFSSFPNTMFSLLAPTHEVMAFETGTQLCANPGCQPRGSADLGRAIGTSVDVLRARLGWTSNLTSSVEEFAAEVAPGGETFGDVALGSQLASYPAIVTEFMEILRQPASGPTFRYLHLLLPHVPWLYYDDGTRYRSADPFLQTLPESDRAYGDLWSPWSAAVTQQRHLLQATYADELLGTMLAALKEAGAYDRSLIVVMADHGASFTANEPFREPTISTLGDVAYAPLFVKEPNQRVGRIDDSNVMSIDVLPTLAELLGIDVTFPIDGAPFSSATVTQRGDRKVWIDIVNLLRPRSNGHFEYDDSEQFPSGRDRVVGPMSDPSLALSGLTDLLGVSHVIGSTLEALGPTRDGVVEFTVLEDVVDPPPDAPPTALLLGTLDGLDWLDDSVVFVLEVNGRIVTGSRLTRDSEGVWRVTVLLPPGVLRATNQLRAGLVSFVGVVELEVR